MMNGWECPSCVEKDKEIERLQKELESISTFKESTIERMRSHVKDLLRTNAELNNLLAEAERVAIRTKRELIRVQTLLAISVAFNAVLLGLALVLVFGGKGG